MMMSYKKFRWSKVYESSEEELIDFLHARNIDSSRVHMDAGTEQLNLHTDAATTIWCAEGSLAIKAESFSVSLQPGDALRLDDAIVYSTYSGLTDCGYYLTS
jgi:hypothetical protein